MDWVIGILLLLAGAVIGYFLARFQMDKKAADDAEQSGEQTLREIMLQQAGSHLDQTRHMVNAIQQQCEAMQEQMDAYEHVLHIESEQDGKQQLSYFGEHATMYIRSKQKAPKREPSTTDVQPRDFSSGSSGLFDGSKNRQVVDPDG
ncbi:YhcB family protein [Aestuariibacter halophilus]|uniref:YhcB family protein n=1 Tax=Fluctibacter halophilus TaxID=226011 RepID=A0ABS8GD89_9ALTE|nr:DUF1043 family protein [Aestuariibacter halophilus]MCC2617835.1 YhcB family protein [Aestuariibacter halophilus]